MLCSNCINTCFNDNNVSSTLCVYVPDDLLPLMNDMPRGQAIKMNCSLAYSELSYTLALTALTIRVVSDAKVVIK